jgi:hypothetical protein
MVQEKRTNSIIGIISIYLLYLSILSGGGDYRGIYDIGLKGAFMGYIGLLLNDPYKRDRIDGCMLDIFRLICFFSLLFTMCWAI